MLPLSNVIGEISMKHNKQCCDWLADSQMCEPCHFTCELFMIEELSTCHGYFNYLQF